MNPIARNVLRLGTWELLTHPEIPRAVIIDESVEVAKRYGGAESGKFVNGVLDRIADGCGRPPDPPRSRPPPRAAAELPEEPDDEDDDDDDEPPDSDPDSTPTLVPPADKG
jgi:hypothetical protein